jgi:hypothetical protein
VAIYGSNKATLRKVKRAPEKASGVKKSGKNIRSEKIRKKHPE